MVSLFFSLQKAFKALYDKNSARDTGSLAHPRVLIDRKNVNGQVKGKYEQHLDFLLTVTEALILQESMLELGNKSFCVCVPCPPPRLLL